MLTREDLKKIRKIIREEIEVESESITSSFGSDLRLYRMRLEDSLRSLTGKVKDLTIKIKKLN